MIYLLITEREIRRERWESALERSLGWAVEDSEKTEIKSGTQITKQKFFTLLKA